MKHSQVVFTLWISVCAAASLAAQDATSTSLKPVATKDWNYQSAAHLLNRAGFGGTPAEIERLVGMGLDDAVSYLVDYADLPYEVAPPPIDPELESRPDRALLRSLTDEERRRAEEQRRRMERQAFEETRLWWVERMVESPRPLEEKMTLFWHGHFTSGMREVRNPIYMKEQNEFLRKHALSNFRELVLGISRDRAMLIYLDGNRNNKERPNENYARELMELFTLGVGNYSEADIKAAARAFTGWHAGEDGFTFRGRNHDYGMKSFLGKSGKFNGDDVVDIILDQPACAKFVARNLLEFFVRPDPPKALIDAFAGEFRKQKFELRPAMTTLLKSQAFYHADSRGSLVKSPVELIVSTCRKLGVTLKNPLAAERAMAQMGQELMQPPNVKGWDGEDKWINTATLFNRYNIIGNLIFGGGEGRELGRRMQAMMRRAGAEDDANDEESADSMTALGRREARSRLAGEKQPAFDPLPMVRKHELRSADEIVDFLCRFLLSRPLDAPKREHLITYLSGGAGKTFDVSAKDAADRIRTTMHLVCSTPEFQLN